MRLIGETVTHVDPVKLLYVGVSRAQTHLAVLRDEETVGRVGKAGTQEGPESLRGASTGPSRLNDDSERYMKPALFSAVP
jgi:hypothetical protein